MQRRKSWILTALAAGLGLLLFVGAGKGDFISGAEAKALVEKGALLIDVRTPEEFAGGHVDGAVNIPVGDLGERLGELKGKEDTDIVVYCRSGARSATAKSLLESKGFKKVHNMGPVTAWPKT